MSNGHGKNNWKSIKKPIALVVVISSVLLISQTVSFWSLKQSDMAHEIAIQLTSPDPSWLVGEGYIWFENGQFEVLTPWPASPLNEEGLQIGWRTLMGVNRTFATPETCRFEYVCSEMNVTIGPLIFTSNEPQILYQDELGHSIETWISYDLN